MILVHSNTDFIFTPVAAFQGVDCIGKTAYHFLRGKGAGMQNTQKDYETDYRMVTIRTSDGGTVQGKVNVSPNQRVSELFNLQQGPFVVLVNANYGDVDGKTLFINKEHIVWVEPEE